MIKLTDKQIDKIVERSSQSMRLEGCEVSEETKAYLRKKLKDKYGEALK